MKKSQSLVVQMLGVFIILLVLPISLAGFYLFSDVTDNLTQMEKERVQISSQATKNLVDKLGESLLNINQGYSYWEESRVAVEEKNLNWIEENVNVGFKSNPNISFISTTDLTGNVISQVGEVSEFRKKISSEDIIKKVEQKGNFSGLINTSRGLAVISVSKVTNEDGTAKATGYMMFGRILDNKALLEIKETLTDDIAMLLQNNTFLTTTDSVNKTELTNYYSRIQKNGSSIFETSKIGSVDSAQLISTLEDYSGKSIGILYINQKQPASTAVKADLIFNNLIIMGILIGIMVLLAVLVMRRVIFPIKKLVFFSEEMSKGNLQIELTTNLAKRKDEIGQLGNVMNVMRRNFQGLIKEVSNSIDQVATTSEELSVSSEETSKATYEITEAIQEVATGSDTQLSGALSSLHALEKLTSDIHQIVATVTDVSADSKKTENKAIEGSEVIQEAVQQMKRIDGSFAESASVVQQLANRSQQIGQMAELIKSIANQTNLLALNAAIEAARAGEHGKGFSVVADEVRKLAEQTAHSAEQVSSLVDIIQKDSSSSVTSMKKVTNEVQEGLDQIQEMGVVFEQILVSAQQVAEKTNEVSVVSKQMEHQTGEVTLTAERTAEIAKSSTRSSQSVARASQEQLAAIEEISASYQTLTNMALNLKEQISRFQI